MIELEVKLGPKTGLDTVQNEKHVEEEVAPPDDSNQAPLVRVTPGLAADWLIKASWSGFTTVISRAVSLPPVQ